MILRNNLKEIKEFYKEIHLCIFECTIHYKFFGDDDGEEIPVPIPNTEVKLSGAENTCGLPCWEDRKSPNFYIPR